MNPSINDNFRAHNPQYLKVFLRIFIERIRGNRDDVPDVYMSELINKLSSSTKSLVEETTPQKGKNKTPNHPTSKPKEVNVNLKITLDIPESETKVKAEGLEDDFLDSPADEETDITPSETGEEDPVSTGNEEETHINPVSHEETESSTVLENAVEEVQYENDVEKCSEPPEEEPDEPIDNVEEKGVLHDNRKENKKPEAHSYRAIVPPRWYSTLKSETPVSYGWKVASLVRLFESLPLESGDKILVENTSIILPDGDQQSSALTGAFQDVRVVTKEEPTASADEQDSKASTRGSTSTLNEQEGHETSSSSVLETSAFQLNVSAINRRRRWNKLRRPEHGVSGVPCLAMLNYQKALHSNVSPEHTDALLVQQLVMDEYKDDLSRLKQRKIRRESVRKSMTFQSCSEDDSIPEYSEIEENFLYEPCDISEGEFKKYIKKASSDSGLSHSDAAESSRSSVESGEASNASSGYNQQIILKEVPVEKAKSLGDIGDRVDQGDNEGPFYTTPERSCASLIPDQVSIGTSNISALLSSCPAQRSEMSFYSASSRTRKPPLFPTTPSVGYYDSVPNKANELMTERDVQLEITHQVSKAVLICRRQPKAVRQDIQVEAEKILLVATRRRDVIDEELKKCSNRSEETAPISVSVSLKNFNFSRAILTSGNKYCKKYSWFFVLVLEAGTAVLASEVVSGDSEILFKDCFRFEGKSEDFPINVKLFALVLKNHKEKNKTSRRMISGPIPSPDYAPTHSFFNLWGSCELKPSRLSNQGKNCFPLTQIPPEASLSDTFSADTEMHLKIMVFKRGFLTVGIEDPNRLPVWNRRWCVLDGANFKYWNYPNEEEVSAPVGKLDLVKARSHEVQLVSKELCPWPKCLSLEIERSESAVREFFLSADTSEEFHEWQHRLNLVLGYLSKWKSSQEEVE